MKRKVPYPFGFVQHPFNFWTNSFPFILCFLFCSMGSGIKAAIDADIHRNHISVTVPSADSLALVAFYDSTDGAHWSNKSNWLTGPVNTWYGITVADGRVTNIQLSNNRLTGSIPASLGNLTALQYLDIHDNQLSDRLPASIGTLTELKEVRLNDNQFTSIPPFVASLSHGMYVQNNRLTFESLEANINKFKSATDYAPQDSIGTAEAIALGMNAATEPSAWIDGENNHYQWTFNGVDMDGAINARLWITLGGWYGCKITNSAVPGLTIYRRQLYVENLGTRTVLTSDSLALVDLYNSTNGTNWANKTNWLSGNVNTWYGISVRNGRVYDIFLQNNQMSGNIPPGLSNLTALQYLLLEGNQLSGSIPVSIGKMSVLKWLWLGRNQLSGSIPSELGNLKNLTELRLSSNLLSGSIPVSLAQLKALLNLELHINQLSGSIPSELGNLTNLSSLSLYGNQLSGGIPVTLGKLKALTTLQLGYNPLSGTIPDELGNLLALQFLSIYNAQLSGSIPASLGKLTSLSTLGLSYNQLSGSIPEELGNLINLSELYLNDNQLSGGVPESLGKLPQLQILYLQSNQFISLPVFTSEFVNPYGYYSGIRAQNNRLTFEALESNINKFKAIGDYSPQDSVGTSVQLQLTLSGQPIQLSAKVGGTNNYYQWTLNGAKINGATNDTLSVSVGGEYSCRIINPLVPGLTLHRRRVFVNGRIESLGTRTVPASDSLALVDLYHSTNGANWKNHTNWLTGKVNTWYGVTVKYDRVTEIALSDNQMSGSLSASLVNLSALQNLRLNNNQLGGVIPASLGDIATLQLLNLESNHLSGPIPASLGNLEAMQVLSLYNNQLSGSIPETLGNLASLQWLILSNNQLSSSVPVSLGNLADLKGIFLAYNQLVGSIPAGIGNLTNLQFVFINNNRFNGLPLFTSGQPFLLVHHNNLTFESLEANQNKFYGADTYAPQDSVGIAANLGLSTGESIQLSALVGGANNLYQWTRNGVDISGATAPNLAVTEAGSYSCRISNSIMTGLTLHRRKVNVGTGQQKKPQAITFAPLPTQTLGNPPFILTATASSGLSIVYTSSNPAVASIVGNTVTLKEEGTTTITANQVGDSTYHAAAPVSRILIVNSPRTVSEADSLALVDFYNNTQGTNWKNSTNWLLGKVTTWHGVGVANGRVTSLYLYGNQLGGHIPASLGNLTALEFISLSNGQLSGPIPSSLGKLNSLKWLYLDNNQLSGPIPDSLGNLTALEVLYLDNNQLSGLLPAKLGDLTGLSNLGLSSNELNGSIPASWSKLTALKTLSLDNNQLSGPIPADLGKLTSLQWLSLSSNQLSGSIPSELGDLTDLGILYLSENQLSGAIPSSLGNLTSLAALYLSNNQLDGSIPSSLGNLSKLTNLSLDRNRLSGHIPASIGNLKQLTSLYLYENQLNGSIPASLGNLTVLEYLHLNNNQLSGSLPSEWGNLKNLVSMHLNDNQLSGSIPASFGKLQFLVTLFLNNNHLSGSIPATVGNLTGVKYLKLDNNQFTSVSPFLTKLSVFHTGNNRLTFESLEANVGQFKAATDYTPQDSVLVSTNIVLPSGQSTELSALVGGANNRYQWTRNGEDIAGATQASLTVSIAGSYGCKITNALVVGLTLYRRSINVSNISPISCQATGTILREYWAKVNGNQTIDVPVNKAPTSISYLTSFEGPTKVGENYASRIRGYLCAPETGNYTFWIASDDYGDLYLSSDDNPANKQLIAWIKGWSNPRQWNKHYSQKSALIYLEKGKRYYIEALHKQAWVNDNLAVAWRIPSALAHSSPVVIPGTVLSPYILNSARLELAEMSSTEEVVKLTLQAFPNPFSDQVSVLFTASNSGRTVLDLYNMKGEKIQSIFEGELQSGEQGRAEVDGSHLSNGIYLLRLVNGNQVEYLKLLLNK